MTSSSPLRSALVRQLAARSTQIADSLTDVVEQRVEGLGGDDVEHKWVRSSAQTNIELLLQVMEHPDDLARVVPPLGGVALVRRIAQHDVPFFEIVRGYQHAESYWVQQCVRELATLTTDLDELVTETVAIAGLVRTYIDVVCRGLSVEYELERERWRHQDDAGRMAVVAGLLSGDAIAAEAEAALDYRLGRRHLAAVVWLAGRPERGEHPAELQHVATELGRLARCRDRPLVVARDHTTVWVWLPLTGRTRLDLALIAEALPAGEERIRISVGEPASGAEGFAASHHQAQTAYEVGLTASGEVGSVFPYREVSSLAFLCADLPRTRAWVTETLGPLAAGGSRELELRRTLRTYLAANCSTTAAARLMNCHKNTIQYRIRSVERLLGAGVEDAGIDLDLALLACHWLGEAVAPRAT